MRPWYATREAVKAAPDVKETARNDRQVDRAIDAASRSVDGELKRRFYPEVATRSFPAPRGRVLFPGDLVTVDTLTTSGIAVSAADFDLLPVTGPPFTRIEFDGMVSYGADRRPVEIAGTWGYDDRAAPAGQLAAAVGDTTTTTVDVTDSAAVGVGDLLNIETERVLVADREMLDTGQDIGADLTASVADTTVAVADGTGYSVGEVLLIDSERVLVVDVAGNDLTVRRAWDGSVLAAHTAPADISALRRLTVERGVLGTTAASHTLGTAVTRQLYPGPVVALTVALALQELLGEPSGYGRQIAVSGSETQIGGRGLDQIRDDAKRSHGLILLA